MDVDNSDPSEASTSNAAMGKYSEVGHFLFNVGLHFFSFYFNIDMNLITF